MSLTPEWTSLGVEFCKGDYKYHADIETRTPEFGIPRLEIHKNRIINWEMECNQPRCSWANPDSCGVVECGGSDDDCLMRDNYGGCIDCDSGDIDWGDEEPDAPKEVPLGGYKPSKKKKPKKKKPPSCYGGDEDEASRLACMPPEDEDEDEDIDDWDKWDDPDSSSSSARPLSPGMGGPSSWPLSGRAEQEVRRILALEGKKNKAPSTRPIDPMSPEDRTPRPSGGGGFTPSPVGLGVMTPMDDDALSDGMWRKFKPHFSWIPELYENQKGLPLDRGIGPRPSDPSGYGHNIMDKPRPKMKQVPIDPRVAGGVRHRSSKRKESSSFSLNQMDQKSVHKQDDDEMR